MQLVIHYDDGTSEALRAGPQASIVSAWGSFRPGVELFEEPQLCRWGPDFFSAAINEGNLRSGIEPADEEDGVATRGFRWELIGSEREDCQKLLINWIGKLGAVFDPECPAEDYLYKGLLRILTDDEARAYENDKQCWLFYLSDARQEALRHFATVGIERPNGG